MQVSSRVRRAFTLVEVLMVVIVLGILAAIVVPQFSSASDDANLASLTTNLQTIRGQLELYKMQHNSTYPMLAGFTAQMTAGTKADGTAGTDFGPYLMNIPVNPFSNVNTLTTEDAGSGKGWYYNQTTGEFRANDSVAHRAM